MRGLEWKKGTELNLSSVAEVSRKVTQIGILLIANFEMRLVYWRSIKECSKGQHLQKGNEVNKTESRKTLNFTLWRVLRLE